MSDTTIKSRLEGTHLIVESGGNTETYDSQFLVAALLIFIARGSGTIEPEETAKMLDLIQEHFQLAGSESLELLTRVMSDRCNMVVSVLSCCIEAMRAAVSMAARSSIVVTPPTWR